MRTYATHLTRPMCQASDALIVPSFHVCGLTTSNPTHAAKLDSHPEYYCQSTEQALGRVERAREEERLRGRCNKKPNTTKRGLGIRSSIVLTSIWISQRVLVCGRVSSLGPSQRRKENERGSTKHTADIPKFETCHVQHASNASIVQQFLD